jgi:TonB family protein
VKDLKVKISVVTTVFFSLLFLAAVVSAQNFKTAVLPVEETGKNFQAKFRTELAKQNFVQLIDNDLSLSASRALNYKTLFNLSLEESRNLGAAIDCEFFFVVKSDTVRRSSFKKDVYFESFANIFLVSARSGRLVSWESITHEADKAEFAENNLLANADKIAARFAIKLQNAAAREREERGTAIKVKTFLEISDAATPEKENIRTPLPYRSLKPAYTEAAARYEVEAAVEISVELNVAGAVENAEIVRWAGFGLDEETIETVRKMQFRPALRDGGAIPVRFALRYNFRRPRP